MADPMASSIQGDNGGWRCGRARSTRGRTVQWPINNFRVAEPVVRCGCCQRGSSESIRAVIHAFDDRRKEIVTHTGFGGLINMPSLTDPNDNFSAWLLSKVDVSASCITVDELNKIPITPEYLGSLFGIVHEGREINDPFSTKNRKNSMAIYKYFRSTNPIGCVLSDSLNAIKSIVRGDLSPIEVDKFRVLFVVMAMSHMLHTGPRHDYESRDYWHTLANTDDISKYNWAKFIFAGVMDGAKLAQAQIRENKPVTPGVGCNFFLQLAYAAWETEKKAAVIINPHSFFAGFNSDSIRAFLLEMHEADSKLETEQTAIDNGPAQLADDAVQSESHSPLLQATRKLVSAFGPMKDEVQWDLYVALKHTNGRILARTRSILEEETTKLINSICMNLGLGPITPETFVEDQPPRKKQVSFSPNLQMISANEKCSDSVRTIDVPTFDLGIDDTDDGPRNTMDKCAPMVSVDTIISRLERKPHVYSVGKEEQHLWPATSPWRLGDCISVEPQAAGLLLDHVASMKDDECMNRNWFAHGKARVLKLTGIQIKEQFCLHKTMAYDSFDLCMRSFKQSDDDLYSRFEGSRWRFFFETDLTLLIMANQLESAKNYAREQVERAGVLGRKNMSECMDQLVRNIGQVVADTFNPLNRAKSGKCELSSFKHVNTTENGVPRHYRGDGHAPSVPKGFALLR
ncbi:hypothetical protein ACP70R_046805 [Stipagrostis hirtigluma subsp. patula]